MKTSNQAANNITGKNSAMQPVPDATLFDALNLTAEDREALAILCGAYKETPAQYIRNALRMEFSAHGDAMHDLSRSDFDGDRKWAANFIPALEPIFQRIAAVDENFRMPPFVAAPSPQAN